MRARSASRPRSPRPARSPRNAEPEASAELTTAVRAQARRRVMDAVLVIDKPIGPTSFDVVRQHPAGGAARGASGTVARSIRRPRACCRSAWAKRPSWRSSCSTPTRQYDFTVVLRRRDRHRRRGRRGHGPPRRGRGRRGRGARRAGAIPRRDHPGAADLLGAQAGRPPALRVRAGGRGRHHRAARGGRSRAGADVVRRRGHASASRCAARRGPTCGRWRAIWGGRWAWGRT